MSWLSLSTASPQAYHQLTFPQKEKPMPTTAERRRTPRYPFIAQAEIIDERENARTSSKISDLSLGGCYVELTNPFPPGTNVTVEIYSEDEFLEANATVAFQEAKQGMGLTFREMPDHFTAVLKGWLAQAKNRRPN
jgi:PilZ domain